MKILYLTLFTLVVTSGLYAQKTVFFVGTTNTTIKESIVICELDEENAGLKILNSCEGGKGPGYLTLSADKKFLYAGDESIYDKEKGFSTINAFQINPKNWTLSLLSSSSSMGKHPCHLSLDDSGNILSIANYSSGSVAMYSIKHNGEIGKSVAYFQHQGSGPDSSRQQKPHAHYIQSSNDGKYIFAADLGIDKIMIYKVLKKKKVIPNPDGNFFSLEPGSGPRHMAFHPDGQKVFILNELSSTITSCIYNPDNGNLSLIGSYTCLEKSFNGSSTGAAVRIHPNGNFVYCSNRGENSISVFRISDKGELEKIQSFKDGIGIVRDFNISPSGKFLIAGNQKTGNLIVIRINEKGLLENTGNSLTISEPTCIVFY